MVNLCRNAAWALSNMARGTMTSALPFLATMNIGGTNVSGGFSVTTTKTTGFSDEQQPEGGRLFMGRDLAELLAAPELIGGGSNEQGEMTMATSSWYEVSNEVCWLLAFLTAREDDAVSFLCNNNDTTGNNDTGDTTNNGNSSNFSVLCEALAVRLHHASQMAATLSSSTGAAAVGSTSDHSIVEKGLKTSVPCIRIIGNIATACDGKYVPHILLSSSNTRSCPAAISESLANLIKLGYSGMSGDASTVAVEACWATGTILCDAGYSLPNPSTVAAKTLLPVLCDCLISGYAKLELKREAMSALWNAVAVPPPPPPPTPPRVVVGGGVGEDMMTGNVSTTSTLEQQQQKIIDIETRPIRDDMLRQLASTSKFIESITELLTCSDGDAILASIRVINAMVRQLIPTMPIVRIKFEEMDIVDKLEGICDGASADMSSFPYSSGGGGKSAMEQSADIAADLIDDIFEKYDSDEDNNMGGGDVDVDGGGGGGGGVLTPGLPFGVAGHFDSSGALFQHHQAHPPDSPPPPSTSTGGGVGRGRGRVIPSWMSKT